MASEDSRSGRKLRFEQLKNVRSLTTGNVRRSDRKIFTYFIILRYWARTQLSSEKLNAIPLDIQHLIIDYIEYYLCQFDARNRGKEWMLFNDCVVAQRMQSRESQHICLHENYRMSSGRHCFRIQLTRLSMNFEFFVGVCHSGKYKKNVMHDERVWGVTRYKRYSQYKDEPHGKKWFSHFEQKYNYLDVRVDFQADSIECVNVATSLSKGMEENCIVLKGFNSAYKKPKLEWVLVLCAKDAMRVRVIEIDSQMFGQDIHYSWN